jgi:acetolactate synthase-1/2/3 large subunit
MGFGLPSALGAKVAAPNKTVIDIDGDSSFSMTAMELATASQFNIGVKVMVMNDGYQGMVTQWEGFIVSRLGAHTCLLTLNRVPTDMFYNRRHLYSRMINPDFVQFARSMGVHAIRVSSASELPVKMKEFLEYDGNRPVLLDCVIASHQHLYPLVCPGSTINFVACH